jgi:hypothetical protein
MRRNRHTGYFVHQPPWPPDWSIPSPLPPATHHLSSTPRLRRPVAQLPGRITLYDVPKSASRKYVEYYEIPCFTSFLSPSLTVRTCPKWRPDEGKRTHLTRKPHCPSLHLGLDPRSSSVPLHCMTIAGRESCQAYQRQLGTGRTAFRVGKAWHKASGRYKSGRAHTGLMHP